MLHRPQRQAELDEHRGQRLHHRRDRGVGAVEVELVAGVHGLDRRSRPLPAEAVTGVAWRAVQQAGEIPLHLQPHDRRQLLRGVLRADPPQHPAWAERVRRAVAQVLVPEHPCRAGLGVREQLERLRIRDHDEVAGAGELAHPDAGIGAEKVHRDRVPGVEQERPRAEVHPVAEGRPERVRGERLRSGEPMRIAEREANQVDVFQARFHQLRGRGLLLVPPAQLGDQARPTYTAVWVGAGPLPRGHCPPQPLITSSGAAGRRPRSASIRPAAASSSRSRPTAPTSCRPTGSPDEVRPAGSESAGWPVRLNG